MTAGFDRASLSISLDCGGKDFPRNEDQQRVYYHELIHFWQTLSEGFITRQALLEWQRLRHFEQTGDAAISSEFGTQLSEFFRKHPDSGFSTWNLSESLARFWDIYKFGAGKLLAKRGRANDVSPHDPGFDDLFQNLERDAPGWTQTTAAEFDYLMQLEDWYAEPYRLALQTLSSQHAVILFPLVGHFALQSRSPIDVFVDTISFLLEGGRREWSSILPFPLVTQMLEAGLLDRDFNIPRLVLGMLGPDAYGTIVNPHMGILVEPVWLLLTPLVKAVCDEMAKRICGGVGLEPGWVVMDESELRDQRVYRYVLPLLKRVVDLTREQFVSAFPDHAPIPFSTAFACPGSVTGDYLLRSHFLPPLVMFLDTSWFVWGTYAKGEAMKIATETVARESYTIRILQQRLDRASVLSSLGGISSQLG